MTDAVAAAAAVGDGGVDETKDVPEQRLVGACSKKRRTTALDSDSEDSNDNSAAAPRGVSTAKESDSSDDKEGGRYNLPLQELLKQQHLRKNPHLKRRR